MTPASPTQYHVRLDRLHIPGCPQLVPHFRFNATLLWIEKNGSVIHSENQMWK